MLFFYIFSLFFYRIFLHLAAFFHPKAKSWVNGRTNLFSKLEQQLKTSSYQLPTQKIWFHCASLGEFEQGRPLIEKIKSEQPNAQIILTFFSPSGYEIRKNYALADHVFYLPLDSKKNAKRFLDLVQPTAVIFVKYEFWYHYLNELQERKIPTYLISAIFRESQPFFKWYGGLHRKILTFFMHLFVQNSTSVDLLQSVDIQKVTKAGDTRVDRVNGIASQAKQFPLIEQFLRTKKVLIAGSTWAADEAILVDFINKNPTLDWQFIFAQHEVNRTNVERLRKLFEVEVVLYSELVNRVDEAQVGDAAPARTVDGDKVLVIDNIGMLSALYQYGKLAYIGGGFGKAIHNILEPIAFGIPVLFGPNHTGFHEALALKESGGGFVIHSKDEFAARFSELEHTDFYQKSAEQAENYIESNLGATEAIYEHIFL
ncbi:MAG: 3-deoxy-D-manno-octulosonic acid transferase [Saprospiraceae bacterium]